MGIGRILLLGCGGLLALAIVLFVVGALLISSTEVRVSTKGTGDQDRPDARAPFAAGSSATVTTAGDVTLKLLIDRVIDPATSTNRFQTPTAGNRFVAIELTIENVGTAEAHGGEFLLRTTDGFEHRPTTLSGLESSPTWRAQTLTSGGKVQGVIAFEIKDDAQIQWLKFDPNSFAKGDLYFEVQ